MYKTFSEMEDSAVSIYNEEVKHELHAVLDWWMTFMIDDELGGFRGAVHTDNQPEAGAPKGLVLNSRILWTFSSAYLLTREERHLTTATRAFDYLVNYFLDREHGGFYWSVDSRGEMLDGKKQIYGQAFAIYGFAEYFKASGNIRALSLAKDTFSLIEKYSYDHVYKGYIDAFTQTWAAGDELRLSEKDLSEKKLMNTHLHLVEAYANLYTVWKSVALKEATQSLLSVFKIYILDQGSAHLNLFFTEAWKSKSNVVSFGHDIEASWLLLEAAEIIGDAYEIEEHRRQALKMSSAVLDGLDTDGGLWDEYDKDTGYWNKEKHWWQQAEAMIGFYNAWQLSGEERYLHHSLNCWSFIKKHILDGGNGEWHWGVKPDYTLMDEPKAGFWKCPYHNARACMEIMKRTAAMLADF